jgi:hypothetical protein
MLQSASQFFGLGHNLSSRKNLEFATWNVRRLRRASLVITVAAKLTKYKLD